MTEEYHSVAVRAIGALWGVVIGLNVGVSPLWVIDPVELPNAWVVVVVALVLAGLWRGATVRVVADANGLVVRNLFRTYAVRWTEIEDVRWCAAWETRFFWPCPYLRVRGRRRRIRLFAMTKMRRNNVRLTTAVMEWRSRYGRERAPARVRHVDTGRHRRADDR